MSKNMLPRVCRECGVTFLGGPRAWYCPECREERRKKASKEYKERKRSGRAIPLGSAIKCEICGKEVIKRGGLQRYCEDCAKIHLKEIDNAQSLEWKQNNLEKVKESKRNMSKKRHAEEGKRSGFTGVYWDKGKRKWRATVCLGGVHYKIISTDDKELAIQARKEAESMEITSVEQINALKAKYRQKKLTNE